METTTLYKLDSKGKTRQWSIRVDGAPDSLAASIIIETGLVDGKKVEQFIEITEGKDIGKQNQTTPYTQALAEAQSKIDQQLRSGYVESLDQLRDKGTLGSGLRSPMLAQKYDKDGKQKGSKTLDKMKLRGEKIHVQPKLDGNRCLIVMHSGSLSMYTRKGDVMPVQLEHILNRVLDESDVVEDIILDGELFSTELSFNELNGHLKRKDNQDQEQLAKIKYHLYDVMVDAPYSERYEMLQRFQGRGIEVIPSYEITATEEEIQEKLEEFLGQGHEGLMIRRLDMPYENKRSWQLCKVKTFQDFEAKLLDVELDKMGRLGAFILEMPEPSTDRDGKPITTFKAGTTGLTHEEGMNIVANKDQYIGKLCTIECFDFSEYLVPRFPKVKQLAREDV